MALDIKNVSTTINSVTFLADSVPAAYHGVWGYSLNGGGYVVFDPSSQYRVNHTITGLAENTTYSLRIRAYVTSTGATVYSPTINFTTKKSSTAPTVTVSATNVGPSEFTLNGTANYPCKEWEYTVGAGWKSMSETTSATSVSKVITGLDPATQYAFYVRAKRTYNNVQGTSAVGRVTTLGESTLNSVNTVVADDATVSVILNWTVTAGTGFTHTLRIKDGGTTVVTVSGLTGSSGSKTIELTGAQRTALLGQMPNKKSFNGTFELETLNGATRVGSLSTKTATVTTTEENSAPTFAGFAHSEQNATIASVVEISDYYVQNMSVIGIEYSAATAKNGASLKEYGATIGGKTVTSVGLSIAYGAPTVSGDAVNITVYAEDSRGYKTGHIASVAVKYYSNPQIVSWQARRKDSIGETVSLNVVFAVRSYLNSDLSGKKYRYRKTDDDTWSSWLDLGAVAQITSTMADFKMYELTDDTWETFDANKSFYVQMWCSDNISGEANIIQFTIARGIPLVSFRDGKVGINQYDPQAALDIVGGFRVTDTENDGIIVNDELIRSLGDMQVLSKTTGDGTHFEWTPAVNEFSLVFISRGSFENVYLVSYLFAVTVVRIYGSNNFVTVSGDKVTVSSGGTTVGCLVIRLA